MKKETVVSQIGELFRTLPGNVLTEADDILPEYVGTVLFDEPLVGAPRGVRLRSQDVRAFQRAYHQKRHCGTLYEPHHRPAAPRG